MERRSVVLAGGLETSYLEGGSGHPLIMLPGWSQSAAEFERQFDDLSRVARVIAVDQRGHGETEAPDGGYRIQRLAKDLQELIVALDLDTPDLLGHSMGASVIWSYLSLFAAELPVRRLVIVDQAPAVLAQPGWDEQEMARYGCLLPDAAALAAFEGGVIASDTVETATEIIRGMFTADLPADRLAWIAAENLKMPREQAAHLLHDHCVIDWRSEIAAIRRPTLVIGAEASIFSAASQRWIAEQIPGAEVDIFPADDGGSHFMFYENPDRFNARVSAFLGA
jgi:pimeloyl-ACP methyl ester carboxylesterase